MIRATTPLHVFRFMQHPLNEFDEILVTYSQRSNIVLEKHKSDFLGHEVTTRVIDGVTYYYISYGLTEEEANLFSAAVPCFIQVRVKTTTGIVMASTMEKFQVKDVLNDEILSDEQNEVQE